MSNIKETSVVYAILRTYTCCSTATFFLASLQQNSADNKSSLQVCCSSHASLLLDQGEGGWEGNKTKQHTAGWSIVITLLHCKMHPNMSQLLLP